MQTLVNHTTPAATRDEGIRLDDRLERTTGSGPRFTTDMLTKNQPKAETRDGEPDWDSIVGFF